MSRSGRMSSCHSVFISPLWTENKGDFHIPLGIANKILIGQATIDGRCPKIAKQSKAYRIKHRCLPCTVWPYQEVYSLSERKAQLIVGFPVPHADRSNHWLAPAGWVNPAPHSDKWLQSAHSTHQSSTLPFGYGRIGPQSASCRIQLLTGLPLFYLARVFSQPNP